VSEVPKLSEEQRELFSYPFLVRGFVPAAVHASTIQPFFSPSLLIQRYGHLRVDFYPHNMDQEQVHPLFTSLVDGIHQMMTMPTGVYHTVDVSGPGTYLQWNLDSYLFADLVNQSTLDLPRFFDLEEDRQVFSTCMRQSNDEYDEAEDLEFLSLFYLKTHWKMLLLGNKEAGMFFHQDTLQASAWQIQLVGRKQWHICPGRVERHQNMSLLSSSGSASHYYYKAGTVNMFSPDYEKYPLIRDVHCHEYISTPGDLMYYPGDYWHQTKNLDTPTVSMTSSILLSPYDFFSVRKELKSE
jgi:hypothetical protein